MPRSDVEVSWEIEFSALRVPSQSDIEYGGFGSREYSYQLVVDASWEEAAELLVHERETVEGLARTARNETEFDELARAEEDEGDVIVDEMEGFVIAPDLGVRAAVTALCAAGCVTAASCRGHPGEHAWAPHPVILLTSDGERARILQQACRGVGCGIASTDDGRLEIVAPSIEEMLRLAEALIEQRARFASLPLPSPLREARGLRTTESSEHGSAASDDQGELF